MHRSNARLFEPDEIIDDANWINVQGPIRQTFSALTKAVRSQACGIRDLDRKLDTMITEENAILLSQKLCCSKKMGEDLQRTKASADDVVILEQSLREAQTHMSRMHEIMQHQSAAITDLNYRLEKAARDIDDLKIPNHDAIFAYIDRKVHMVLTLPSCYCVHVFQETSKYYLP